MIIALRDEQWYSKPQLDCAWSAAASKQLIVSQHCTIISAEAAERFN